MLGPPAPHLWRARGSHLQALTELHLGISCLFLEWETRLSFVESSSLPTSPLQFTATPLLIQEKKQRLFYNGENSEKAERMGLQEAGSQELDSSSLKPRTSEAVG